MCYLLPAFTPQGSFESVRWNACVHRLNLGLFCHPKEFLRERSQIPGSLQGKNPLYLRLRGGLNPWHCITQDNEPNTLPTELFPPWHQWTRGRWQSRTTEEEEKKEEVEEGEGAKEEEEERPWLAWKMGVESCEYSIILSKSCYGLVCLLSHQASATMNFSQGLNCQALACHILSGSFSG